MGELCPDLQCCALQSRAIACAALLQLRFECVIGASPPPVPPHRAVSNSYVSPSQDLPKMLATTDRPSWQSWPCNGISPTPSLTLATRVLGIPCCRVDPPGSNGVEVHTTPEDNMIRQSGSCRPVDCSTLARPHYINIYTPLQRR